MNLFDCYFIYRIQLLKWNYCIILDFVGGPYKMWQCHCKIALGMGLAPSAWIILKSLLHANQLGAMFTSLQDFPFNPQRERKRERERELEKNWRIFFLLFFFSPYLRQVCLILCAWHCLGQVYLSAWICARRVAFPSQRSSFHQLENYGKLKNLTWISLIGPELGTLGIFEFFK